MTPKSQAFLGSLAIALPLDQASKLWIATHLRYADRIPVVPGFFYITHVRNPGAAFGLFTGGPTWLRLALFIGISILAVGLVLSFYRRLPAGDRLTALALGLILAGALGNLVDRVARGEVVDFLHFRLWGGYVWPDFNLADSFIVVGVGLLLVEMMAGESDSGESRDEKPPSATEP